jgi:hypothetical protein
VIDAKHVALVDHLRKQPVHLLVTGEVLSERLLEDHLAAFRKPRPMERRDRDRGDGWRQRKVDRDGCLAGEARRDTGRIAGIVCR